MFKSKSLSDKLKKARLDKCLTQEEAARCICSNKGTIGDIERTQRRISNYELGKLAKLYGKPLTYFLDE